MLLYKNTVTATLPSGFAALDAELPGGGWPLGALCELLPRHVGIGELRLLGPALARLSAAGRSLAWIAPPHRPYAPALAAAGIDLARVLVVNTRSEREAWWAAEQALASRSCGAVLLWPGQLPFIALRRLSLASAGSSALSFLFRAPDTASNASPAVLRLALSACVGGLRLDLLKRRGAPALHGLMLDTSMAAERSSPQRTQPVMPADVPAEAQRAAADSSSALSFTRITV
jgi:cell division inhibitor SulA/protein ImuA